VIEVSAWLIEQNEDLRITLGGAKIPCQSGKQLGSLYVGCQSPAMTLDYLPRELLQGVRNLSDFAGVLVLDKWTCNSDGRQAIFCRKAPKSQRYCGCPDCTSSRSATRRRFDFGNTGGDSPACPGCGLRRAFSNQISQRPWRCSGRCRYWKAQISRRPSPVVVDPLGRSFESFQRLADPTRAAYA
jgi:hypothetical protein